MQAVPHDVPVAGFRNDTVNTLRLWGATSSREFDFQMFNAGDYVRAVERKKIGLRKARRGVQFSKR